MLVSYVNRQDGMVVVIAVSGVWGNHVISAHIEHIGHVVKMSVSGYNDRRFKLRLHQYVVSLSKELDPHCFRRLSCETSTRRKYPREGGLFSARSSPEETSLIKSAHICLYLIADIFCQLCILQTVDWLTLFL